MAFLRDRFEHYALSQPGAVAITCGDVALSYGDLNRRANRLAGLLASQGVGPESAVGLCLERGLDLIVAMLAVWKAGAGYVAMDPDYPAARLAQIIGQSDLSGLLTRSELLDRLPAISVSPLCLDRDRECIEMQDASFPSVPTAAEQLAYVMFTSGSTGVPKGVEVTQGNLAPLFDGFEGHLPLGPAQVWTLFHSPAFGYSVWEIWGALAHGARLVVVPARHRSDPAALYRLLRDERVTVLSQTPSAFRQNLLGDMLSGSLADLALSAVVLSGEPVTAADLAVWFARHGDAGPRLINTYAITETAGQLTQREYRLDDRVDQTAGNVGVPLPHVRLFILDESQQPVAQGTAGELYVGGPGVARGYRGQPELSASRFLTLRPNGGVALRVYRTGDRARLRTDGSLEFLGRVDGQVKVRGYRVELGEIEAVIGHHPGVCGAAAAVRTTGQGDRQLVGYFVADRGVTRTDAAASEFWPSLGPYQLYDDFLYDLMSTDGGRLDAFRRAFESHVAGKVVLDVGTGADALMARMCVDAGARRVYAVEILPEACRKARALITRQGLENQITLIEGDIASIDLPETVEICVQGLIGNIGSADGVVSLWNAARRFFRAGCIPIPGRCQTMIAPVELPAALRERPTFSPLAHDYVRRLFAHVGQPFDVRLCIRNLPHTGVLAGAYVFEDLDFRARLPLEHTGAAVFSVERDGWFDGFLAWTVLTVADDVQVDYLAMQQAWLPVFFPLADGGMPVRAGDQVTARWARRISAGICPDYRIEGNLRHRGSESRGFDCISRYRETAYNATALHRALWARHDAPEVDPVILRDWLAERLPDYMVPAVCVELAELPVNAHGKLDREALPAPASPDRSREPVRDRPATALEQDLVHLWEQVLEVEPIGVLDNFFDLGGDSISAVRLTSALQRLLNEPVPLVAIFDALTVAKLADYLRAHHGAGVAARYRGRVDPMPAAPADRTADCAMAEP